jgi:hypothetical protein
LFLNAYLVPATPYPNPPTNPKTSDVYSGAFITSSSRSPIFLPAYDPPILDAVPILVVIGAVPSPYTKELSAAALVVALRFPNVL